MVGELLDGLLNSRLNLFSDGLLGHGVADCAGAGSSEVRMGGGKERISWRLHRSASSSPVRASSEAQATHPPITQPIERHDAHAHPSRRTARHDRPSLRFDGETLARQPRESSSVARESKQEHALKEALSSVRSVAWLALPCLDVS